MYISCDVSFSRCASPADWRQRREARRETQADSDNPTRRLARALAEKGVDGRVRWHVYTERDLIRAYPALVALARTPPLPAVFEKAASEHKPRSLAWGFHAEAINCWFQALPPATKAAYEYVWVLEDDVGYTGNIAELVASYAAADAAAAAGAGGAGAGASASTSMDVDAGASAAAGACTPPSWQHGPQGGADLLTWGSGPGNRPHPTGARWYWKDVVSPGFEKLVPPASRCCNSEHCQRFSARLLDTLHAASSGDGAGAGAAGAAIAWSEQSVPSICKTAGLQIAPFREEHIGHPFSWDGRISETEWNRLRLGKSLRTKGKLFHALKF